MPAIWRRRHDEALAERRRRRARLYDYRYTFNGFAAELTDAQAAGWRRRPGVLAVTKDELQTADTSSTPTFLGLDAPAACGTARRPGQRRRGHHHRHHRLRHLAREPSFSDRTGKNGNATKDGKLGYQQIPGWHGKCTPGEAFNASTATRS